MYTYSKAIIIIKYETTCNNWENTRVAFGDSNTCFLRKHKISERALSVEYKDTFFYFA